jgi:hypothetical protein
MSEEATGSLPPTVSTILANPQDKVPPEKLLELMEIWKAKINEEIAEYQTKKDGIYATYKRQKDLYDKWLAGPIGKMKKLDKTMAGRKKVLIDIDKEIAKIKAEQQASGSIA